MQETGLDAKDFRALRVSLASPEEIRSWSYGEVTKPETINYRRLRPEKDGLFCEAIFGPTRDWQCYCGKYKNVRYKGLTCDKCGVEITRSSVRRERMGHIELAAPVAHVWYTRRVPSYLGLLTNVSRRNLDRVLYFAQYVVTHVDEDARQKALKRLQEEMEAEIEALRAEAESQIGVIESARDGALAEIADRRDLVNQQFDEELSSRTDELMQAAQHFQQVLETRAGEVADEPLVFDPTGDVIVEAGEVIGPEHISRVQDVAGAALNELQADIEERRQEALSGDTAQRGEIVDDVAERVTEIEDTIEQRISEIRQRYQEQREELESLQQMQFLGEARYRELKSRYGQVFKAGMGAGAFYDILQSMDLDKLSKELWHEIRTTRSKQRRKKATKRLRVVEALRKSGNRPEWMILTVLPVIPPDLRPMVQLDGGRFATSDLNDLYRRVINRNNRLKRLLELGAPDVIVRNEKRMLQEAVDSLIDNSQRGRALSRRGRRELKSLSDMLKGKKGRFRRNLLGKRVDYSGRSVIVIGPKLKLHQCGLPKTMALELYRPFVISRLVKYNYASNVKSAKRIIEREKPEVWEVLEEVIQERPVLLNRAPTLHRLGIQAFEPQLVEGKAIQIHPLVCTAFNADFDGDQMAVHVPLSQRAVEEARELMLSTRNLLKPADGAPIVGPSKDMVLGVYYLTMEAPDQRLDSVDPAELRAFYDIDEVEMAFSLGQVKLHTPILIKNIYDGDVQQPDEPIVTTVGRCIFNRILPNELRWVNRTLDKKGVNQLVGQTYTRFGPEVTVDVVDAIKDLGFKYATYSGATIAISDLTVPEERAVILSEAEAAVRQIDREYRRGLLTEDERYQATINQWTSAKQRVEEAVRRALDEYSSVAIMADSGSTKGGMGPITQLAGMRGLMADPSGRIIDLPILSNFREGLTALEYFISTHGARKGLADTALRTADAGYLTRRLVDVAQDMIINSHDCGTEAGVWIRASEPVAGQTMYERVVGRVAAGPVYHPETGELIVDRNQMINEEEAELIQRSGVQDVYVRSPMTCELTFGLCQLCYGRDLGRGDLVAIGSAVGIVAAQSIGEPGTQLTLRTFHTGGTAEERGDITTGLPRVEEIFEARKKPKGEAIISDIDGVVHIYEREGIRYISVVDSEVFHEEYDVSEWEVLVEDGAEVSIGDPLAQRGEEVFTSEYNGRVTIDGNILRIAWERREEREYELPSAARVVEVRDPDGTTHRLRDGDRVKAGDPLTEGSKNPHRILKILGVEATAHYLLSEVQNVYRQQGVNIADKHFEVIIRRMLSKVQITRSGDTELLPGEMIDELLLRRINQKIIELGGTPASAQHVLLGITKAALSTDSFLSASSFQHTIKVLAGAAIAGKEDPLIGLKENVIIGKLIPAGTGFHRYKEDRGAMLERHADELANSYISSRLLAQQPAAREEVVEFVDDEFDEEEFDEEFEPGDD
ncbi:MAG TPA: DNA-directed RNA polymerase subunit beta' [Aggregatilineales bacterium]|jgi:DNA-directed RNA polymerase subunit beta'|nr:DNA-directed RNA polymerase subunit beta' [Aggregatilineales bacterium]HPV07473.1 DNA-directed RNA polymerase subunit beta' [Aggregatilineales bacterium]HQA68332.1 DNA-directed RNA polymerase subunit beta' [Aggregatilineales bacterium]